MTQRPAAEYVENVTFDLSDDELVTDVVIVAKTVRMDSGQVGLYLTQTDGVSWLEKIGMLRAAERIESNGLGIDDHDHDD